jgi:Txe/YoeB family toxin of Txe-Axe toxin-antitoxin module
MSASDDPFGQHNVDELHARTAGKGDYRSEADKAVVAELKSLKQEIQTTTYTGSFEHLLTSVLQQVDRRIESHGG